MYYKQNQLKTDGRCRCLPSKGTKTNRSRIISNFARSPPPPRRRPLRVSPLPLLRLLPVREVHQLREDGHRPAPVAAVGLAAEVQCEAAGQVPLVEGAARRVDQGLGDLGFFKGDIFLQQCMEIVV